MNLVLALFHLPNFDSPPYPWLQGIIGLSALAMTTVILITQNRQSRLAEQRMHLNIQVNLLIEQKVTKLIDLVEELRRDIPSVQNRHDPQAEAMKKTVNPDEVISNLNQTLEEADSNGI
jgi:uncharacterized membrane protein